MNGCTSVIEIVDRTLGESVGCACVGGHAPGEKHRNATGGITWTDAEAAGRIEPMNDPRVFVVPIEPLPPGTWSNR